MGVLIAFGLGSRIGRLVGENIEILFVSDFFYDPFRKGIELDVTFLLDVSTIVSNPVSSQKPPRACLYI